jgi:signal transduction histidine kinase/CheY-like chemotaxis protein
MTRAQQLSLLLALPLVVVMAYSVVGQAQHALTGSRSGSGNVSDVSSLVAIGRIARTLAVAQTGAQDLMREPDKTRRIQALQNYASSGKALKSEFNRYLTEYVSDKTDLRLALVTRSQLLQWLNITDKIADLASAAQPTDSLRANYVESRSQGDRLSLNFNAWADYNGQFETPARERAMKTGQHLAVLLAVSSLSLLLIMAIAGWRMYRGIINPIRSLKTSIEGIAGGNYQLAVPFITSENDSGALARAVEVLKNRVAALDRERQVETTADELSNGIHRCNNYRELAEKSLALLMPLFGMATAGFYLFDPEDNRLHSIGSYGFNNRKPLKPDFALGETLVGQCAISKTLLSINDLPGGYVCQIASGLGSASPRALYAQPLLASGTVLGVIEIASPGPLTEPEQELLATLAAVIARALETLKNLNIHVLLERSQQQARQVKQQGLELKQSEQEFLAQKDELLAQGRELEMARQTAEAASESKSMFLANVSHEIRTPMGAIIGLSDLALKTNLDETQRDYLRKIHTASVSLLRILNDVLDFSKIEAGKLSVEQTLFWLDDVLNHVALLVSDRAVEKSLEVTIATDPDVPAGLVGDQVRLGQILTNLAVNAVKFTVKGQVHIHISVSPLTGSATALEAGNRVCLEFSVTDTGIGMTSEEAENVFAAFAQADGSTARKYGGTGLGLSIVKRLVELMDGEVTVKSRLGMGSKFRVSLWLGVGSPQRPSAAVPPPLASRRALVVDDNSRACDILATNLVRLGMRADTANSANDAYSAILKAHPDDPYHVVFMDHCMPETDGIEAAGVILCKGLQKLQPQIILATAFASTNVREMAEQAGICGFLTKPVTASSLADVLAQMFGDKHATAEIELEQKPDLSGVRVLLAEDNAINQQIIVELLANANAHVQIAGNGQEALEALARDEQPPFHLLLMDLQMPVMDGYEATRAIRSDPRYDRLPIVALTAHALTGQRGKCLAEGMNEHITKPIQPALLYRMVLQFARQRESEYHATQTGLLAEDAGSLTDVLSLAAVIDEAQGLYHVGGNAELYRSLLLEFAEEYSREILAVRLALANGQTKTAGRIAHTILGVSKTLGATSLGTAAENICDRISRGQTEQLDEQLGAFESALRRVINTIQSPNLV